MNSSYSKVIQKSIENEILYMNDDKGDKLFCKKFNILINDTQSKDSVIQQIRYRKSVVFQFGNTLVCLKALSTNKYIMNQVRYLEKDIGYLIFYQDNDSINIRSADVPILAGQFEKKYGYANRRGFM